MQQTPEPSKATHTYHNIQNSAIDPCVFHLKAKKEDIDYQLRNATGPMRSQWKEKLSQWKQERAEAERDHAAAKAALKSEWQ